MDEGGRGWCLAGCCTDRAGAGSGARQRQAAPMREANRPLGHPWLPAPDDEPIHPSIHHQGTASQVSQWLCASSTS